MHRHHAALALVLLALGGCARGCTSSRPPIHINPNMVIQPRYEPQAASAFFYDGAVMRPPVPGTVARGELRDLIKDGPYWTGMTPEGEFVTTVPIEVTDAVRARGQERFDIYCGACHDTHGDGKGILFERGKVPTPTFHSDRLRQMPVGQIFDTVSNGFGLMPSYKYPIPVADRWAIIIHLRELQARRAERLGSQPAAANEAPTTEAPAPEATATPAAVPPPAAAPPAGTP
ncbi:MAG TPA: cytochrome c [Thermoanaerobaculia bacterium]|nr:cytochrome c [Thermoanaerobaculia bacterium]